MNDYPGCGGSASVGPVNGLSASPSNPADWIRQSLGPIKRAKRAVRNALFRGRFRNERHWFDHPEMQARIAKAEADLREGRSVKCSSRNEAFTHLDSLV